MVGLQAILSVTTQQWAALSTRVGGRLHTNIPFSAPCFPSLEGSTSVANVSACETVKSQYLSEAARVGVVGAYTNTNWETCQSSGEQCLLDWTNPNNTIATSPPYTCSYGSVSRRYIDVQTPQDVIEAFRFSKARKVPLVIRNTGHDYAGRSSGPNSLLLSTTSLKNITYNASFIADGCHDSYPAMTLGAGVLWGEAFAAAQTNNVTIVGGGDATVGAVGGWLQGGGHGILSNTLGLGVDRVLQFKVVVPSGKYLTANACQNKDLFFALRGGGGSTFGVVLEATYKVEPRHIPLQVTSVRWTASDLNLTRELWTIYIENALKWADQGFGGVVLPNALVLVTPILNSTEAVATTLPIAEFAQRLSAANVTGAGYYQLEMPNWLSFFNTFIAPRPADNGLPQPLASRLVQRPAFASSGSRAQLVDRLIEARSLSSGLWMLVSAPSSTPGDGKTSVTEAWRDAIFHTAIYSAFNYNSTLAEKKATYERLSHAISGIREITPDAAYHNEADVYEPNHEAAFWGKNYAKLLSIKNKYDPDRLLDCWHCVGWNKNSSRYSCYL